MNESYNRKDIPGFPGYQIDTEGIIYSSLIVGSRPLKYSNNWRTISPSKSKRGYLQIRLRDKDGVIRKRYVHQLVLESFVGPRPYGYDTCHYPDCDKTNNRLSNLRYDNHKDNMKDMIKHGNAGKCKGTKNGMSKLKESDVIEIKNILKNKVVHKQSYASIARLFNVDQSLISLIDKEKIWKHVIVN